MQHLDTEGRQISILKWKVEKHWGWIWLKKDKTEKHDLLRSNSESETYR
jgi:hypothetical protein